jgi:hypothetical protein
MKIEDSGLIGDLPAAAARPAREPGAVEPDLKVEARCRL